MNRSSHLHRLRRYHFHRMQSYLDLSKLALVEVLVNPKRCSKAGILPCRIDDDGTRCRGAMKLVGQNRLRILGRGGLKQG